MRTRQRLNRFNLSTALGRVVARVGGARVSPGPNGLLLAEGYRYAFPTGAAFTVGDVVITRSRFDELLARHPRLLAHEARHATQWATLGPLFLPAYSLATLWSYVRTRDRALGNPFEVAADLADGGYLPPSPAGSGHLGPSTRRPDARD